MERRSLLIGLGSLVLLASFAWYLWIVAPKSAPWEKSGSLVIATRTIPGLETVPGRTLGVSVDDVMLIRDTGEEVRATVLSRHLLLDETDNQLHLMVETGLAAGEYAGVRLTLSSPEQRNAWQGDEAPTSVTLAGERMTLTIPFRVEPDTTTALILGFEGNKAVREHEGKNLYLPVAHAETRLGATTREIEGGIEIGGGEVLESMMFGMDWDGVVYFNYRAKANGTTKSASMTEPVTPSPEEIQINALPVSDTTLNDTSTSTPEGENLSTEPVVGS